MARRFLLVSFLVVLTNIKRIGTLTGDRFNVAFSKQAPFDLNKGIEDVSLYTNQPLTQLMKMPPISTADTEEEMLTSYLLNPASFPTIITFDEFQDIFPVNQQSHPQVRLLYRDLQFLRTVDTDLIEENITKECRNGERQRRDMYRALHYESYPKQQSQGEINGAKEVQVDEVLYGQTGSVPKRKKQHTKESLLKEMEEAIRYLEVDAVVARREADRLLGQMQETVGHLSNLRPETMSNANKDFQAEVVEGLRGLEAAIDSNSNGSSTLR